MHFAFLADIHGNLPALEAILEDIHQAGVDSIILLGDLLARAPFPRETLDLVRSLNCTTIRGNADHYLLEYENELCNGIIDTSPRTAINRWTHEQIGQQGVDFIRSLPSRLSFAADGAVPIALMHASPAGENKGIVPDRSPRVKQDFIGARLITPEYTPPALRSWFAGIPEKVIACGHTHLPWVRRQNGYLAFNPGAVGVPCNGDLRAQYALLTWDLAARHWQVQLRAVRYDLGRVKTAFTTSGLLEAGGGFARAFMVNMLTGHNVAYFYILHGDALARARGYHGFLDLPDGDWEEATRTFPWEDYPVENLVPTRSVGTRKGTRKC
jgi:predicted phosphodiesterase